MLIALVAMAAVGYSVATAAGHHFASRVTIRRNPTFNGTVDSVSECAANRAVRLFVSTPHQGRSLAGRTHADSTGAWEITGSFHPGFYYSKVRRDALANG